MSQVLCEVGQVPRLHSSGGTDSCIGESLAFLMGPKLS
jgi:hypothetical protein